MFEPTTASPRQQWMSVLAKADPADLQARFDALETQPGYDDIRQAETGLVMVRGKTGGVGNAFNLGEMTVTRGAIRLESGETGLSYVAGGLASLVFTVITTGFLVYDLERPELDSAFLWRSMKHSSPDSVHQSAIIKVHSRAIIISRKLNPSTTNFPAPASHHNSPISLMHSPNWQTAQPITVCAHSPSNKAADSVTSSTDSMITFTTFALRSMVKSVMPSTM